jgi:hypothetical protein
MILRNPTGRPIRLEIPAGADDEAAMVLTIGAHASLDLSTYQRALDTLTQASREGQSSDTGAPG